MSSRKSFLTVLLIVLFSGFVPAREGIRATRVCGGGDDASDQSLFELSEPGGLLHECWPRIHGKRGIVVEYNYTGGLFSNMRGGASTKNATKYMGTADLLMHGRTAEMGLWKNGGFGLLASSFHGESMSESVGDMQAVSVFEYPPRAQVSEFWYEHSFGDFLDVKLGKLDGAAHFGVLDCVGRFINGSFTTYPNNPVPTLPDTGMGVIAFVHLTDSLRVHVGVFDGKPDGTRNWFSNEGTTFSIYQLDYHYSLCRDALPGHAQLGVWYDSNPWERLTDGTAREGNYGWYVSCEQEIFSQNCKRHGVARSIRLFTQYSWSPEECAEIGTYWNAGLSWTGFWNARPDDDTGIGITVAEISRHLGRPHAREATVELFHIFALGDNFSIQPDLQYVAKPSGEYDDAFVFGLIFYAKF
ncbi:MAG TPA: hypothetical protein DEB39_01475 [Planctomycetaceae bacterium]|nr:hypothetical protein [Planctomycetaceae bacterium]